MMLIWKVRFYFKKKKKIFLHASHTLYFMPWELSFSWLSLFLQDKNEKSLQMIYLIHLD